VEGDDIKNSDAGELPRKKHTILKKNMKLITTKYSVNKTHDDDDDDDNNNNHHHHMSVIVLGYLLTRSGLTYPEVSSKVCHDSFCQRGEVFHYPG